MQTLPPPLSRMLVRQGWNRMRVSVGLKIGLREAPQIPEQRHPARRILLWPAGKPDSIAQRDGVMHRKRRGIRPRISASAARHRSAMLPSRDGTPTNSVIAKSNAASDAMGDAAISAIVVYGSSVARGTYMRYLSGPTRDGIQSLYGVRVGSGKGKAKPEKARRLFR